MGIRLIVEILDHWQDVGLTAGERGDLIVLAENANDKSRETWGPVHAEHILKRAAKTPASWRIAINRLMKKKALEFALRDGKEIRGYTGQHAVYRIVELCPEPPHSGYKGHCTKPEKGVDSADTPAPEEGYPPANPVDEDPEEGYLTANPEDYLTANAVDGEGYLTATERVSGQLTPTPLYSSFDLSSKDSPSSSVAEDSCSASVIATDADDGGGGGDLSLEEITKQAERAASFVDSLAYRGRQPGKKQRQKICQLVVAAFKEGWTENGLRRYLDISDDATVRSPAAVYVHRLSKDELPEASVGVSPQLPPACSWCLARNPAAATDPAERVAPLGGPCPDCHPTSVGQSTMQLPPACPECLSWSPEAATDVNLRVDRMSFHGGPCPRCHPATMGQSPEVPPACELCIAENPAAEFNVRFRYRVIDDEHQACPNCHPKRIIVLAAQRRDTADGGMWERAAARAAQRKATGARAAAHTADDYTSSSVDDLFAPRAAPLPGTDTTVSGWMALSRRLAAEDQRKAGPQPMIAPPHQPYRNPVDQSVYDEPFWPEEEK